MKIPTNWDVSHLNRLLLVFERKILIFHFQNINPHNARMMIRTDAEFAIKLDKPSRIWVMVVVDDIITRYISQKYSSNTSRPATRSMLD